MNLNLNLPFIVDDLLSSLPNQPVYDVFMALGDYRFAISTAAYDSFRRETRWRWPAQERIGREPARQYVGRGDDTITLDGTIYPHFRGGLGQIAAMRAEANLGVPLLLVDGLGYVHDYWCVTSISESVPTLGANGVPLKQQFTVTLEFYGDDYTPLQLDEAEASDGA
ncbi:phage tail protein [Burkholderia arboris]|uniref:Phage tail protein n=1 Tax=Burkholderia metallica TaxID=488729 RepID=A0ABT8PKL6_9BURK|nr:MULTISPECIES: phage tail protein [Burkholderia cepacia complex]MCA8032024.1 phage tail protein [Burkholderia arboris]MDN7935195.1 phage tail protein [Burkholderia metallica]